MPVRYDDVQIAKHGLTRREVDMVLRSQVWEELGPSERGNDRVMFVGFSQDGRLVEVGVEYFDEQSEEWVFHADIATAKYKKLFEKGMKA